jgi:hypothetical protein
MKEKLKIRKIHLVSLMAMLQEIYDRGVEFVDIHGKTEDGGQDTISITFCKKYMSEENAPTNPDQFPAKVEGKLTDEDLNQLI